MIPFSCVGEVLVAAKPAPVSIDISTGDWKERLITIGQPPVPRPNLTNCLVALRYAPIWRDVLAYNDFTQSVFIGGRGTPWGQGRVGEEWDDNDDRLLSEWLQRQDIFVGTPTAAEAVQTAAREHSYSPLINFLNNLEWDGTVRVASWLPFYLGVVHSDYSSAVGTAWLISAVARAYQPGCKADYCLILEGPQGKGKSTALQTLASPEFFSDYIGEDLASKDASQLCLGTWIIELSELESLRKSEVGIIKSFLSRSEDRFRPPYGRRVVRVPRQCVFAGTTNGDGYLRDETGGRRFWPVLCHSIKLGDLHRDREQLWAEAVHLYLSGIPWWLTSGDEARARIEQSARFEADVWQECIAQWVTRRDNVTLGEILEGAIKKQPHEWGHTDQVRVARSLAALGWVRYRTTEPGRPWRYRRVHRAK